MLRTSLAVLLLVGTAGGAAADRKAADSCASRLPPESQAIYRGTIASKPTPETGRRIVTAITEKMIQDGKLALAEARPAAEAAGKCLELLGQ